MERKYVNIIVILVLLDQFTKYIIRTKLYLGQIITVAPFFNITYVTNTGIAFGVFKGANIVFAILSILILTGLIFWYVKNKKMIKGLLKAAVVLIISGAFGNLIDRIVHGKVIDFLELHAGSFYWPSFNVADSCISIGGMFLFVTVFISKEKDLI